MFRPIATSFPMTRDSSKTRAARRRRPAEPGAAKVAGARRWKMILLRRAAQAPPIVVPELRDYQQINAELVRRLNLGERHVRLEGVDGQRLLVSRIAGAWKALIELDGNAGPELAAELDAPDLTVVCRGSAADGAGRGLAAGRLLIGGTGRPGNRLFPAGRSDRRGRQCRAEGRPGPAWRRPCAA